MRSGRNWIEKRKETQQERGEPFGRKETQSWKRNHTHRKEKDKKVERTEEWARKKGIELGRRLCERPSSKFKGTGVTISRGRIPLLNRYQEEEKKKKREIK